MTAAILPDMPKTREHHEHNQGTKAPVQAAVERVVLTGFMGSGKSTVGALLAQRLGWEFLDLDMEIERCCGMTIQALFAEFGEAHFRKQEAFTLASVLGRAHVVIALGGGAPETPGNRLLLEQTPATEVVFLQAPFPVLHDRCVKQAALLGASARPLLADRGQAETRYQGRLPHYECIASLQLDTSGMSSEEAADALVVKLHHA